MAVEATLEHATGLKVRCLSGWAWRHFAARQGAPWAIGYWDGARISLSPFVCGPIRASLNGQPVVNGAELTGRAKAWHVVAHELGHAHGYDHGERSIGADCWGFLHMTDVMEAAGLPREMSGLLLERRARLHPCEAAETR